MSPMSPQCLLHSPHNHTPTSQSAEVAPSLHYWTCAATESRLPLCTGPSIDLASTYPKFDRLHNCLRQCLPGVASNSTCQLSKFDDGPSSNIQCSASIQATSNERAICLSFPPTPGPVVSHDPVNSPAPHSSHTTLRTHYVWSQETIPPNALYAIRIRRSVVLIKGEWHKEGE
ncbi:hypothetical protein PENSPDRAFT_242684 [Peniophora sp. CONT]|nr:hypothetical protein PENSPDRAFT_242684 [Peniophora sp. CONT]